MQVSATGFSQRLTLKQSNVSITKLFYEIRKQTGYDVLIKDTRFKLERQIDANFSDTPLAEVMDKIIAGTDLSYSIEGKAVVIKEKNPSFFERLTDRLIEIDVRGRVIDSLGMPIAKATVRVMGTQTTVVTNERGEFFIAGVSEKARLYITYVGFQSLEVSATREMGDIVLKMVSGELAEVNVINTGYQRLSPERTTGSYATLNNEQLNRKVGNNILDRIDNLVAGVNTKVAGEPTPGIVVRGRSTLGINNSAPLIVLDNFVYDGNIGSSDPFGGINPNDVESITILKDAAAASIWGARAGNGVIVITTKRGKTTTPKIDVNSSINLGLRTDLYDKPLISPSEFIDQELMLFDKGFYNANINNVTTRPVLSPVVEIMVKKRNNLITTAEAEAQINALRNIDSRDDLKKYFYRNSVNQQHSVNVSGNTPFINYYLSSGLDNNIGTSVGNERNRYTLRSQNTFRINPKLQATAGFSYTQSIDKTVPLSLANVQPYTDLVDNQGKALQVANFKRSIYLDTVGGGKLLDWKYRPYDELNYTQNKTVTKTNILSLGAQYQILPFLNVNVNYEYQNYGRRGNNVQSIEAFAVRTLINDYTQVGTNGALSYPIPRGGILDVTNNESRSHQGRAQLNYNQTFGSKHQISALGGWEIKDLLVTSSRARIYGYNRNGSQVNPNIDYVTRYSKYTLRTSSATIPNSQSVGETQDRFISYFANASYTYSGRYTVSGSARKDAANLFGVKTNQKGVPLWSAGAAWQIDKEKFYSIDWLPTLKLRASYGFNGNYNKSATAYATAVYGVSLLTGLPIVSSENPPNEELRWELVNIGNVALDFGLKNNRFSGTVEFYKKNCTDLISSLPYDPTLGAFPGSNAGVLNRYIGNAANLKGQGLDITLNSNNLNGQFKWSSNLLFSYSQMKVTKYLLPASLIGNAYIGSGLSPVIGMPLYNIYSYKWGGLDPATGDPLGYLNNNLSKDYSSIYFSTPVTEMVYNGPAQAPYYGAFMNTFGWKNISVSANISYRLGYYFRRPTVDYGTLSTQFNKDYNIRWQKPGDETLTNVPSMPPNVLSANTNRSTFYQYSEVLVEKGDQVRLQDIQINYEINRKIWPKMPFKTVRAYGYISNLGLIWTANSKGVDPDYPNGGRPGKTFAFGLNIGI